MVVTKAGRTSELCEYLMVSRTFLGWDIKDKEKEEQR